MPNYNILAFDYGEKRIGVASGNTLLKIPHPLTTVNAIGLLAKLEKIKPLILTWQPKLLVVGIPHEHQSQQKQQLINTIKNFSTALQGNFSIPVILVNEDFSSTHASSLLREQGITGYSQKKYVDELAACSILAIYFSTLD